MKSARVGIIGVGPRGLTILERIVANERVQKSADLHIYLFDPNPPGVGCHDPAQEEYLLVNTVAGQITQFSDSSVIGAGPILVGPSFYEWLKDGRSGKLGRRESSEAVSADKYYSRALFGLYLHWVYHYLVALAPPHVTINLIREAVVSTERRADDSWVLSTQSNTHDVDFLYLTSGHTKPNDATSGTGLPLSKTRVINDPYPIRKQMSDVPPESTVAIEGMGLTMFDVLAALTVGRGGRFAPGAEGPLRYIPSGREPRLIAFSRSGIPLTARAVNEKGISVQYRAKFLLAEKIRALRELRKLDFVTDVFPLLLADMQYAYYEAYLRERSDPMTSMLFSNQFVCAGPDERQQLIEHYVPAEDRFSWERLVNPIPKTALAAPDNFDQWLSEHLQQDLVEAHKGNVNGPLKAACDVVRDLRDNLRVAIDFGGLTEASHRWLLTEFVPIMNRIAVGPPATRIAEMLALAEAGVLDIGFGPNASCQAGELGQRMRLSASRWPERSTEVDVLIKARISMPTPHEDASPLLRSLLEHEYVRPYYNGAFHPGGIEVDRSFNLVSGSGTVLTNAWSLGIPTEGPKFYTFVVPRSGVNSTALVDAGRAVAMMLSMITGETTVASPAVGETLVPTAEYASAFASLYGALS